MKTRYLIIGFVLGVSGSVATSCGGTPKCSPSTCATGCCGSTGKCELGNSSNACGQQGNTCTACTIGQLCQFGSCQLVNQGGGTGGSGGGTAGGTGGSGGGTAGGTGGGTAGGTAGGTGGGTAGGFSGGTGGGTAGGFAGGTAGGFSGGTGGGTAGGFAGGTAGGVAGGTGGGFAGGVGGGVGGGVAGGTGGGCVQYTQLPSNTVFYASYLADWTSGSPVPAVTRARMRLPTSTPTTTDYFSAEYWYTATLPTLPLVRTVAATTYDGCDLCLVVRTGCTSAGCTKFYLAQSGSATVTRMDMNEDAGRTIGNGSSVHFVEWTYDGMGVDQAAAGGGCVDLSGYAYDATWLRVNGTLTVDGGL